MFDLVAFASPLQNMRREPLALLKWLALVFMTMDHVNKFVLLGSQPWMYELGRVAMPLFAFVFAHNLAGMKVQRSALPRLLKRLFCFAVLAQLPYLLVNDLWKHWWPLNILFTLFFSALIIYFYETWKSRWCVALCSLVFAWGGLLVEFWWPAVALVLSAYFFFRKPSLSLLFLFVFCLSFLYLINASFSAFVALPLIFFSLKFRFSLPRAKLFFYAFYPAHLALIFGYLRLA